jgi:hypothetical protein
MYRAIKYTDGGEAVEFRHFNTLNAAYTWLVPSIAVQQEERWHIKLLTAVIRCFEGMMNRADMPNHAEIVGWNEMQPETTIYIQTVQAWDDALPRF